MFGNSGLEYIMVRFYQDSGFIVSTHVQPYRRPCQAEILPNMNLA